MTGSGNGFFLASGLGAGGGGGGFGLGLVSGSGSGTAGLAGARLIRMRLTVDCGSSAEGES